MCVCTSPGVYYITGWTCTITYSDKYPPTQESQHFFLPIRCVTGLGCMVLAVPVGVNNLTETGRCLFAVQLLLLSAILALAWWMQC